MGNFRSNFTDQEWSEIQNKIQEDIKRGKPTQDYLSLSIHNKSMEDLMIIRNFLLLHFSGHELSLLDKWIKWKEKNQD